MPSFPTVGGVYSYNFLPFLLMDIVVKNSTTRDVLNAVLYPRWQILMGGVVILIIVQIYTFFLVSTTSTIQTVSLSAERCPSVCIVQ